MQPAHDLQRLCENWWEKVADATRGEQHRFAEHFLDLLAWEEPCPAAIKALAPHINSISYILRAQGSASIAAHFTNPGALEPPSSVVKRGLDFCDTTATLFKATRSLRVPYCYVTDLFRSYLYDVRTEELLAYADSPTDFREGLGRILNRHQVELGSLEELRRDPRSHVAAQLRAWRQRWYETLIVASGQPEDSVAVIIDRLVVLRLLIDNNILKRAGQGLRAQFDNILANARSGDAHACCQELNALFHTLWMDWKADLFAPQPALDAVLERDKSMASLIAEFSLLARTKFCLPTVLESFNYGDAAEKGRVRMIPEGNEERETLLRTQSVDSIDALQLTLDVDDEGYLAALHWLDRLVEVYDRLATEFALRERKQPPIAADFDLFDWSKRIEESPKAFNDPYFYALERGLTIHFTTPRQWRTVRLLLYLHVIAQYAGRRVRFTAFPPIEQALNPRPRFPHTERAMTGAAATKRVHTPYEIAK